MPFKLAYSTNAYTKFTLAEAIESIAGLGFAGVEILADRPHLFSDTSDEEVSEIKKLLSRTKMGISNINANTAEGLGLFEGRTAHTKKILEIARQLGAPNISISIQSATGWDSMLDAIGCLGDFAGKYGIKIGIEYEPGFFISNCDQLLEVIWDLNHPAIGANLDIGHVVVNREKPSDVIKKLKGKIWNIHIEDIKGGVHNHLIAGKGDIDFYAVRDALLKTNYDRWLTLEIYPYKDNPAEAGKESLEFLKKILNSKF